MRWWSVAALRQLWLRIGKQTRVRASRQASIGGHRTTAIPSRKRVAARGNRGRHPMGIPKEHHRPHGAGTGISEAAEANAPWGNLVLLANRNGCGGHALMQECSVHGACHDIRPRRCSIRCSIHRMIASACHPCEQPCAPGPPCDHRPQSRSPSDYRRNHRNACASPRHFTWITKPNLKLCCKSARLPASVNDNNNMS